MKLLSHFHFSPVSQEVDHKLPRKQKKVELFITECNV